MTTSPVRTTLGSLQQAVDAILARMQKERVITRLWDRDHTLWKPDPTEISNRLGWLDSPAIMLPHLPQIRKVVDSVREAGYTHVLLLGMGGSSLAPEVFRLTFGVAPGFLDLQVLDTTDPDAIRAAAATLDPARTLFIPATKSGGTVETMSFLKYFYNRTAEAVGVDQAGAHFIAITDPGSGLADLARDLKFRHTFLNDPDIGGRYSALSFFGLVPALLIGVDAEQLLQRARDTAAACTRTDQNAGALLGAALGAGALAGRDKVTLVSSPPIAAFGAWVEQLIAESTGKEGKGILPVDNEPLGPPAVYGDDRLFVYLRLRDDDTHDRALQALIEAGQPVLCRELDTPYDLGREFFCWEIATVVAGYCLGINPFDQPDVETAKILARDMVQAYQEEGRLPELEPTLRTGDIAVFSQAPATSLEAVLAAFLDGATTDSRGYIALQAYVAPDPQIDAALADLRRTLRDRTRRAITLGYGPRFLHSTGQLHKGDAGRGRFIQLTGDPAEDVNIPDAPGDPASSITFGTLKAAQARGDCQALMDAGRQVLRLHLSGDVIAGLEQICRAVS